MTIDEEIFSEFTTIITSGTKEVYHFANKSNESIISVKLLNAAATLSIQSAIESKSYVEVNLEADILWENIKINGTSTASITTDILSQTFSTPSVLKLDNPSLFDVRISLRCNN